MRSRTPIASLGKSQATLEATLIELGRLEWFHQSCASEAGRFRDPQGTRSPTNSEDHREPRISSGTRLRDARVLPTRAAATRPRPKPSIGRPSTFSSETTHRCGLSRFDRDPEVDFFPTSRPALLARLRGRTEVAKATPRERMARRSCANRAPAHTHRKRSASAHLKPSDDRGTELKLDLSLIAPKSMLENLAGPTSRKRRSPTTCFPGSEPPPRRL